MTKSPGAAIDSQIEELGTHLVERTDRLAEEISRVNTAIEAIDHRLTRIIGLAVWCGVVFGIMFSYVMMVLARQ